MSWHLREADHVHHRKFEQLLELHRLTESWINELRERGSDRPSHFMDRGFSSEITDQLWMLGALVPENSGHGLNSLLDDTSTSDVLGRLERTVWSVQAYTLSKLLDRARAATPEQTLTQTNTKDNERRALRSVLEQTSWRLGRDCAEKRWATLRPATRRSVRRLVLTLNDTPFGGEPEQNGILVTRVTESEVSFELRRCAHQSSYSEVRNVADTLCELHMHWIKGFAYGLNPSLRAETGRENARCRCRWRLLIHSKESAPYSSLSPIVPVSAEPGSASARDL